MTKVISLELAKRLAPYLENIETEYFYDNNWEAYIYDKYNKYKLYIKTLTLEEAIEFLPKQIKVKEYYNSTEYSIKKWYLQIEFIEKYMIFYINNKNISESITKAFYWKTLLEAIQQILTYLLDNNLLWQKN
jgi:hypothetical protein